MTLEDYSRNVRGINDGENFSPEFVVRFLISRSSLHNTLYLLPANDIRSDSET